MATLHINGVTYDVPVQPLWTLAYVLREKLGLTGTKEVCRRGECGNCTVLIDGKPVLACLMLSTESEGKSIITIEGLAGENGKLHPIQEAFIEHHGLACGHCTPAMILSAKALLDSNPSPTEKDIRKAISGVICRCTGYTKIIKAIMAAAKTLREQEGEKYA
ncbi:(2Fe-2S)-binding protein [Chloroflexota bacterium]